MAKTRTAADIMSTVLVTTTAETRLTDAIALILRANVSVLPVVNEDGMLLGILSEYDMMNLAFSGEAARTRVGEVMSHNVVTVAPGDSLESIVNTCLSRRMHRVPVVRDGALVGIISRRDILREVLEIYREG